MEHDDKPGKKDWELKRDAEIKSRMDELKAFWMQKLLPGHRVLEKVSGTTGEVYKIFDWGVEVWVQFANNTRQNWTWPMLAMRFPRNIKRYPRPFRFPREEPTQCCHCKMGRMEVEGENEVRCTRCKLLVGDESFPRRIKRAESFLKKKYSQPNRQRKVRKRVARPKRKTSHPRTKRKTPSRVGVRTRGTKEKSGNGKSKPTKKISPPKRADAIPKAQGTNALPPSQEIQIQTNQAIPSLTVTPPTAPTTSL